MTEAPKRIWIKRYVSGNMNIAWYECKTRNLLAGMEDIPYVQAEIANKMLAGARGSFWEMLLWHPPRQTLMIDEAMTSIAKAEADRTGGIKMKTTITTSKHIQAAAMAVLRWGAWIMSLTRRLQPSGMMPSKFVAKDVEGPL